MKGNLYIAVGLPGSGKTTWIEKYPNIYWHSSDEVRERILGNVNEQRFNKVVFYHLHEEIRADLKLGRDCYYDATNLTPELRRDIIRKFKPHANKIIAIYFNESIEVCKERNSNRERKVPEDVIDKMANKLQPPELKEGFDEIFYQNPLDKLPRV